MPKQTFVHEDNTQEIQNASGRVFSSGNAGNSVENNRSLGGVEGSIYKL